jgi:hypothetical protein
MGRARQAVPALLADAGMDPGPLAARAAVLASSGKMPRDVAVDGWAAGDAGEHCADPMPRVARHRTQDTAGRANDTAPGLRRPPARVYTDNVNYHFTPQIVPPQCGLSTVAQASGERPAMQRLASSGDRYAGSETNRTLRNRWGWAAAHSKASMAPVEWPASTTGSVRPSPSMAAVRASRWSATVYATAGHGERPKPSRSGQTHRVPGVSRWATNRHDRPLAPTRATARPPAP